MGYRFLPHTADVAVELWAPDHEGLYQAGVDALRELLVGTSPVERGTERPLPRRGADPTERLIHFLGDVLYLYETERFLAATVTPRGVRGEPYDPAKHAALREIKAVTHHAAAVEVTPTGYHTILVFDV